VRGTVFEFDGIEVKVDEGRVYLGGERVMGAYISAGHSTAVDTETGSVAAALERMKEELTPPSPAGVDAAPSAQAAVVPVDGGLDLGFDWSE
jgi:hypothetical protein